MDRNRRRLLTAAALAPLLQLGGCQAPPPLTRVGGIQWIGSEPLFLARELGLYDPSLLRLVEMPSSTDNLMLLATGDVEAATLTLDECLFAREGGIDVRAILVFDYSAGADVVMARPEIARLEDLKGRRIGVEENAASALMLAALLKRAGLTPDDLERVLLTGEIQLQAYREREVDALVTWEPFATRLEAEGARRLLDSRAFPGLIVDVLAARAGALESAPDNFHRLVAGYFRALAYLDAAPDDALRRMAPRLGMSESAAQAARRGVQPMDLAANRGWLDGPIPKLATAAENLSRTMQAFGLLQRMPRLEALADPRFLPGAA